MPASVSLAPFAGPQPIVMSTLRWDDGAQASVEEPILEQARALDRFLASIEKRAFRMARIALRHVRRVERMRTVASLAVALLAGLGLAQGPQVYLSEVCADAGAGWIELHNRGTASAEIGNWCIYQATLTPGMSRNYWWPIPAGTIGKPSSVRTRARTVRAISAGEPKRCVHPATSAKASSMEMRSMSGVKSLRTPMAASPSR